MTEYEMPMEEQIKSLAKKIDALDQKFDGIDKKFDGIDKKFDGIDKKFDAMDQKLDKLTVRLDDTHAVAKLGLEGIQGVRESMDEKFEEAAKASADQTELLKSLFVHVRKRVEVIEQRKPRRRRS